MEPLLDLKMNFDPGEFGLWGGGKEGDLQRAI